MTENVKNRFLEHLKKIQAELSAARKRDREVMLRLGSLGTMIARIGRYNAHAYEDRVRDRHALDALKDRVERLERRLELGN